MQAQTISTKQSEIKHDWHLINVKDQTLGRICTEIAGYLMGKSKPSFVRNLDCGDYVVVTNAQAVKVTGKKDEQKVYVRHSGYPGGLRTETLKELRAQRPEEIIRHAVKGMLPDNRLRAKMLKRLFVFPGEEHTYQDKFVTKEATA
ncbi:MAG TPA: 50S ribosomal protein L13 [Patescibacteria group bacterium]|nr:50S ribosomal protein L13 [Patescibacteria group bacterium]